MPCWKVSGDCSFCNLEVRSFLWLSSNRKQFLIHLGISSPSHPIAGKGTLFLFKQWTFYPYIGYWGLFITLMWAKWCCLDKLLARWQGSLEKYLRIWFKIAALLIQANSGIALFGNSGQRGKGVASCWRMLCEVPCVAGTLARGSPLMLCTSSRNSRRNPGLSES